MKVCKKVRLLQKDKDGQFIKNENFELLRSRAVISEDVVAESEYTYKETGILWIVDENQTTEWLKSKEPVKEVKSDLVFDGLTVTEDNIDDFIKDNNVNVGNAKTAKAKLLKVEKWINEQN